MLVREVRPAECRRAGEVVLEAYRAVPNYVAEPDYEVELADVAGRRAVSVVAVAVNDGDEVVGCVTYVPGPDSAHAEFDDPDAAGFRMLGVDPARQGTGAGRALVQWCLDQARQAGRRRVIIHSTPWMTKAHSLYRTFGFERRPDLDWRPLPAIQLWGFVAELDQSS